jgi:hypothetical protein
MLTGCEICTSLMQSTGALVTSQFRKVFHVLAPERLLVLCTEHAAEVENTRATTLDELRRHFLEPFPGQRSLIPRRTRYERDAERTEPRTQGRRVGD